MSRDWTNTAVNPENGGLIQYKNWMEGWGSCGIAETLLLCEMRDKASMCAWPAAVQSRRCLGGLWICVKRRCWFAYTTVARLLLAPGQLSCSSVRYRFAKVCPWDEAPGSPHPGKKTVQSNHVKKYTDRKLQWSYGIKVWMYMQWLPGGEVIKKK